VPPCSKLPRTWVSPMSVYPCCIHYMLGFHLEAILVTRSSAAASRSLYNLPSFYLTMNRGAKKLPGHKTWRDRSALAGSNMAGPIGKTTTYTELSTIHGLGPPGVLEHDSLQQPCREDSPNTAHFSDEETESQREERHTMRPYVR
jgi:hypothetical protein